MSFFGKKKLLISGVAGIVLLGCLGVVCYHDIPGMDALLDVVTGSGAVGWRKDDVAVSVDGKIFTAKAYRATFAGQGGAVIFLTGVPIGKPDGTFAVGALKVGRYYLAQFNDGGGHCFGAASVAMVAGQSAGDSYYLEDDCKGWSAKYQITDRGDMLCYRIFPTPDHPGELSFDIPKKYFGNVPATGLPIAGNRIVDGTTLSVLPYRDKK